MSIFPTLEEKYEGVVERLEDQDLCINRLKAQLAAVTKERDDYRFLVSKTPDEAHRLSADVARMGFGSDELSKTQAALECMREGLEGSQCKSRFATMFIHDEYCPKCRALARADSILKGET